MYGHAAAAADVDGDGWTDLFVGGFADRPAEDYRRAGAEGPSPDRLLRGGAAGFTVDPAFPGEPARTSGATFADLDDDGDLDLVVVRNPRPEGEVASRPTTVYRNDGGTWVAATTLLPDTAGRSVAALDVDRDGLLDLAIAGDRYGDGPPGCCATPAAWPSRTATAAWGLPDDVFGLALVPGRPRRRRLARPRGQRRSAGAAGRRPTGSPSSTVPVLEPGTPRRRGRPRRHRRRRPRRRRTTRPGVGQHFNSTVDAGRSGCPCACSSTARVTAPPCGIDLVEVTAAAGSPRLWTKSPHVAIADLDADGATTS